MTINDPAIVASLLGLGAVGLTALVALARLVYRLGKLSTQVEHLRHDAQRRHDAHMLQSLERHEALVHRLIRLETYFSTGRAGHD